ncbi:unnamed protein product [Echinostoma caproni]|uniref:Secreted protein n=1 Tax=Echinostoma caproni TaxID=27848 RepID=A0A183B1T9_9TREM|nr:unnamed protein product [Echinostoma caproni]
MHLQTYSTLISLAVRPLCHLRTLPTTITVNTNSVQPEESRQLWSTRTHYLAAFGQLTRALTGLLWRHGENCFQTYTDSLPSYFFLISGLSNWVQQSKAVNQGNPDRRCDCAEQDSILRPELVEELYDFDTTAENTAKT